MNELLVIRWLGLVFLGSAVILGGLSLWRRRSQPFWSMPLIVSACSFLVVGLGGLDAYPQSWAPWIAAGAAAVLLIMLVVVIVTGYWWAPAGFAIGAVLLLGLGGIVTEPGTMALNEAGKLLWSLEPLQPAWLLLLLLLPVIVWLSFRSLSGLGPIRRCVAISLRCVLLTLLILALADTHARRPEDNTTVLFLWDRSLSIPQEIIGTHGGVPIDGREERIRNFINEAAKVDNRGVGRASDKVGVIVFGRQPRLELPPAGVDKLQFRKVHSTIDDTYTDVAGAIKLALASFPEGTGKRVVLISDGNQNLGNAEEQARIAKQNGVQIDVVPIAAGRTNMNEVLVERIEAPAMTEKGSRVPLRIVLRSYNPRIVVGNLVLTKMSLRMKKDDKQGEQPDFEGKVADQAVVKLRHGLNVFFFSQKGSETDDTFTYEAKFAPMRVENERGDTIQDKLVGDRFENNRASVNVMARGERMVLLVEPKIGDHQLLVDRLRKAKSSLKVVTITPDRLPQDPTQLALVLAKFDSIILANLPAETLSEEQQKVVRSVVHDQGSGLVMVGGPQSFGAGGWQNTEIEKALPVTCDLKSIKVEGKSGLVMMMHASEMAEGNAWQKKIAKLAIEKLSPMDMIGMLYWNWDGNVGPAAHTWHIPFQQIADRRARLFGLVDSMQPGDMPDVDPALIKAYEALTNPNHGLGTKHIIFISDGDHWDADRKILAKIKAAKITCTTVCITTHGAAEIKKMALVAALTGGRSYHIKDGSELPAIYIKETRLVSQSFVHEKKFEPRLRSRSGPTEGFEGLEPLYGFVRTTRRPSPLVEVPIETDKLDKEGNKFPILAHWHYGLGKTVAFTSDSRSLPDGPQFWDRDWASGELHGKFWEQTVDWSLRAVETGKHLHVTTELRDGRVRVIVEAQDENKLPITNLLDEKEGLRGGLTSPSLKQGDSRQPILRFEQKNAGVYEAEFKAEEVGSHFINIQARWKDKDGKVMTDTVRTGVTIPYSPEFAEMESNSALLERLAYTTGGKIYSDDEQSLTQVATSGDLFRPLPVSHHSLQTIWFWLVVLAGVCLFFDVAVRRITVEPVKVVAYATATWDRLRGRVSAVETTPQFLDRLKSRKAQVSEAIDKFAAARRFESDEGAIMAPVPTTSAGTGGAPVSRKPAAARSVGPDKEKEPQDFASRLMKAKKKAMEERDKGK